jgi:hypothetical protein
MMTTPKRKITRVFDAGATTFYSMPSFDAASPDDSSCGILPHHHDVAYRCMWCTLTATHPIGCPVDTVDGVDARGRCVEEGILPIDVRYITFGVFCSLNCAKAYVDARPSDARFARSDRLLVEMAVAIGTARPERPQATQSIRSASPLRPDGRSASSSFADRVAIRPSPDPMLLMCYGGVMSEERYRSTIGRTVYECRGELKLFPMSVAFREMIGAEWPQPAKPIGREASATQSIAPP